MENHFKNDSQESSHEEEEEAQKLNRCMQALETEAPAVEQPESDPTEPCETFSWTVPIQVTVSMGTPQPASGGVVDNTPNQMAGVEGSSSPSRPASESGDFKIGSVSPNRFSWQTALSTALASKLAYETESSIVRTTVDKWGFSKCRSIDVDDTQCFLAESSAFVLLSFRGTENLGDWLANLNVWSTARGYGKVHRGFLRAFQVVGSELESLLNDLNGRPLLLTGHSLGGALATIAAAEWQGKIPISGVYTFGQPGVGKGGFPSFINDNYDGKFYRFVNDDDIVPRVPPTYRHVGKLFHFDSRGNLKGGSSKLAEAAGVEHGQPEVDMLSESEFDRLRSELHARNALAKGATIEMPSTPLVEGLLPSVSDHSMDGYIEKVKRMI